MNRGIILDIINIDNPRVIFLTDLSRIPLNVSINDVDPTLLHLYIKNKYDGCMDRIKWFKNQADQWRIIHSYLSNVTPLDTIEEDENWDQRPPTQTPDSPTQKLFRLI